MIDSKRFYWFTLKHIPHREMGSIVINRLEFIYDETHGFDRKAAAWLSVNFPLDQRVINHLQEANGLSYMVWSYGSSGMG